MTDNINRDFVGIHLDAGGTWSFGIPIEIERISESFNRFEGVARKLFGAFEGFIRPTELEYSVQTYSRDGPIGLINPINEQVDMEMLSVERNTIVDESGLTADDLPFESYTNQREGVRCIGDIESTRTQTRLTLNDYDGWIDRTTDQYAKSARLNTVYDEQAKHDLIGIQLYHMLSSACTDDRSTEFVISIASPSDIWFEETPVGRANRRRLEAFFERLFERFDIVDTSVTSRGKNQKLRDFLPD